MTRGNGLPTSQPNGRPVVTIRDVALDAGVSVATVSRVLNNSGYVSAAIRPVVEEAAARLNYRPSRRAQSLRRAKSMTIAAVVPELVNPVYVDFLRGVQRAAQEREYVVVIGETRLSAGANSQLIKRIIDEGVDGVVLGGPLEPKIAQLLRDSGIPTFPGDDPDSNAYAAAWESAETEATRQMTLRLLELGHRRVALVVPRGPAWPGSLGYRKARTDTIRRELARLNCELVTIGVKAEDQAEACTQRLLELASTPDPATAFVVFNHSLTPPFLLALKQTGAHIPQEASVVAYGDSAWAAAYQPALSVIRHDTAAEASWYTRRLIDRIEMIPGNAGAPTIEARFVERESCAPPPNGRPGNRTRSRGDTAKAP